MLSLKSALAGVLLLTGVGVAVQAQDLPAPSLGPPKAGPAVLVPAVPARAAPAAGLPMSGRGHALTKEDVDIWLDGYLPFALRSSDIPGAVVTVVKDGKILTTRGFGFADVAKRTPVDPDRTLFRPGSVSKLFTWTAVMQQVELGKIDLDADINTYLDFKIPARRGRPVTMRNLMTHTGGFEETSKGILFYDRKYELALGDYLKRWVPTRIFDAGTMPAYSNWATALAAYVVQRTSGEKFDDYLDGHIFKPLGMDNTSSRQPLPARLLNQMASGYPKPGQPSPGFEYVGPAPAGSISASGTDMGRFMIAHLQNGELDGQRILQPQTAAMMHDSPLDRIDPASLIPPLNRMHLGFFETNVNGRAIVGHLGDTIAFHTSLHLFLRENVGLYISFNSPGKAGAVGPLRTAVFEDFADRYFPDIAAPDGRVDAKTAAAHARMMTGNWWASRRAETTFLSILSLVSQTAVSVGPKGELVVPDVKGTNGRAQDWTEISPFVWRATGGHDLLAAQVVDGKVARWSYSLPAPFELFDRVPAGKSWAWIKFALIGSGIVLLLTVLYWPYAWAIRRRFKVPPTVSGRAFKAYRATRIMAGLTLAGLVGWVAALATMLSDPANLAGAFDTQLWLLKIAGCIVFVGAVGITGWNAWLSWTGQRHWSRKVWNTLIFLSAILVLYVATTFGLLALSANY